VFLMNLFKTTITQSLFNQKHNNYNFQIQLFYEKYHFLTITYATYTACPELDQGYSEWTYCFNTTPVLWHNSLISESVFLPQFLKVPISFNDSLPISNTLSLLFVMGVIYATPNTCELL